MADSEKKGDESQAEATDENKVDAGAAAGDEQEPQKLKVEVAIEKPTACERHIRVTIPREEIDRYFDREYSELMGNAQVPGFRPGRAPRKLVEHRFHKDVADRVKSALLLDGIAQVSEDESLSAISEPDFDLDAVTLPKDGPMTFEFDLEVRPEFALPKWKGLSLEKPVHEFTTEDVDQSLKSMLARRGRLVPFDGPAEKEDYISANLSFRAGDKELSRANEEVIRIRPVLSFRDGTIEAFDELMSGVRAGETRTGKATISADAPNAEMRGKQVEATFEVLEVKKLELPELTPELLRELGDFELEADLRDEIRDALRRRLEYRQQREAREQITAALTVAADWELPPELLKRQSHRELQRAVMELQRSGFADDEIRARENELRQNIMASTARALKEHFILERIAEDEKIEPTEQDYDEEIRLIAAQTGESPRRARAQLEKGGMMDVLRNQVVERKVIELILSHAQFKEVPYQPEGIEAEALDKTVAGGEDEEAAIPAAKPESSHAASSPSADA